MISPSSPDGLGILIAVIATVVGSLAVIFSINYMQHHEEQLARYYALILFFIGAMAGLGLSGNLFFTFLFWEITALCSYALISFHNDDPKAVCWRHQGSDHDPAGRGWPLAGCFADVRLSGRYADQHLPGPGA